MPSKSPGSRPPASDAPAAPAPPPTPVTSLEDPRALQILSTEHWSLLSARSLAYNEAFTRGGMFLTFVSMSFVALALLAQAMPFDQDFLVIAAIILGFDLIIGLTTYGRIIGANIDDLRAVHGMSRIRHGYTQIAPVVAPFFTTGVHDDLPGVMVSYGNPPTSGLRAVLYGLTTSGGMIGLIVAVLGGVLAAVVTLALGGSNVLALAAGAVGTVAVFVAVFGGTAGIIPRHQAKLGVLFPSPEGDAAEAR